MQIVLTQKERDIHRPNTAFDILVVFKAALREVAGFDNGITFQVKIKTEIVCV